MGWIEWRRDVRARNAWHDHAAALYTLLAAGQPPPMVAVPDQAGLGPVYLDTVCTAATYYALDVEAPDPLLWPVPLHPAAAPVTALFARARLRRLTERARAVAAPQWRDHAPARVLVTAEATWCHVYGTWQAFPHNAVAGYRLDGDTVVLESPQWAPRALTGPATWTHAALHRLIQTGHLYVPAGPADTGEGTLNWASGKASWSPAQVPLDKIRAVNAAYRDIEGTYAEVAVIAAGHGVGVFGPQPL